MRIRCLTRRDFIIKKQSPLQVSFYWLNNEYPSYPWSTLSWFGKVIRVKIFKLKVKYLCSRLNNIHSALEYTIIIELGNKKLIIIQTKRCVIPFQFIVYICKLYQICTHTRYFFVWGVIYFGLRGEGRRNWEGMEWIWIIWLHWNHLNLVFLDKYFTFNLNI